MIEQLKSIGFTELEAKCYLALIEKPDQTGYEVAKNISSSRSNVYASLSTLHQKGACQMSEGKSVTYSAVPIEEVISKIRLEFKEASRILVKKIKSKQRNSYNFHSTRGLESVESVLKRNISCSESNILASIHPEDTEYILPLLESAEEQGLKVVLITPKEINTSLKNVIVSSKVNSSKQNNISKFSLLLDNKKVIIGSFDKSLIPSAVETKHPAMIEQVLSSFKYDIIMKRLYLDYGSEFEKRYGIEFESILKATHV